MILLFNLVLIWSNEAENFCLQGKYKLKHHTYVSCFLVIFINFVLFEASLYSQVSSLSFKFKHLFQASNPYITVMLLFFIKSTCKRRVIVIDFSVSKFNLYVEGWRFAKIWCWWWVECSRSHLLYKRSSWLLKPIGNQ